MGALDDAAAFAVDPELIPPLTAAVCAAAVNISSEAPETAGHTARVGLAYEVLRAPELYARNMAWAVSTNATVVGKWTTGDQQGALGDLPFTLASAWDAVAGVNR